MVKCNSCFRIDSVNHLLRRVKCQNKSERTVRKTMSHTVNSVIATTSRKRPPLVSDHLVNNRFVSQLNTVSIALS